MKKEFVPYEIASVLNKLGFDEETYFVYYDIHDSGDIGFYARNSFYRNFHLMTPAPLYQQAFRWFREEHGICGYVRRGSKIRFYYPPENGFTVDDWEWCVYKTDGEHLPGHGMKDTYEEAELACLRQLIEIVNQNKDE